MITAKVSVNDSNTVGQYKAVQQWMQYTIIVDGSLNVKSSFSNNRRILDDGTADFKGVQYQIHAPEVEKLFGTDKFKNALENIVKK